jgi:Domain of unknown function (DUF4835)
MGKFNNLKRWRFMELKMKTLGLYLFAHLLICSFIIPATAQELNCLVVLNSDQLFAQQNTDAANLGQLKGVISDFMNTKRWTTDNVTPEERINCKLTINLLRSISQGNYEGNAQITVTRPIYGTTYETVTFSFVDRNFNFGYLPSDPMYFNENSYTGELTQLLAYYAYIILAVDYDSFSKQGGEPYIQRAFNLSNIAQNNSGSPGWKSSGDTRNRYFLTENLMVPFREGLYTYHRLALDHFVENPVVARKQIMEVLNNISQVNKLKPAAVLINAFFDAKGEEISKIMMEGTKEDKQKVFNLLSQLDPGKTEMYRKLIR